MYVSKIFKHFLRDGYKTSLSKNIRRQGYECLSNIQMRAFI